jgi:hypothetical protein
MAPAPNGLLQIAPITDESLASLTRFVAETEPADVSISCNDVLGLIVRLHAAELVAKSAVEQQELALERAEEAEGCIARLRTERESAIDRACDLDARLMQKPAKVLRFKPDTWALGRGGSPVRIDSLHEGGCDYNVSLWQERPGSRAFQTGGSTSYNDGELRRITDPVTVLRVLYTEACEQVKRHESLARRHELDIDKYGAALCAIGSAQQLAADESCAVPKTGP